MTHYLKFDIKFKTLDVKIECYFTNCKVEILLQNQQVIL